MTINYYNSALKRGKSHRIMAPPTERFEELGCVGLHNNLIADGLPSEAADCDLYYSEPPVAHSGLKIFDERAGQTTVYMELAEAIAKAATQSRLPVIGIFSELIIRRMPTPPDSQLRIMLNGDQSKVSTWGLELPGELAGKTNLDVAHWAGLNYTRAVDPCCGYGRPLLAFREAREGNTFVGADYDATCITVMRGFLLRGIQ